MESRPGLFFISRFLPSLPDFQLEFAPQSQEEILQTLTTLTPPSGHQEALSYFVASDGADLPVTVDWRSKGLVTSVKMQVREGQQAHDAVVQTRLKELRWSGRFC